ncbi:hypothetical protein L210DRAFT_3630860 [Boletus edulis BED1]|uniref:Uncharacterized protein n=1 Tax=Boletus edulis BED1 TaxID=1328754 RepID=A0AAD4BV98_BOLED|nr:hypothetical protein L210DRAFT_3630860 [Boletus edulis BED1]
MIVKPPSVLLVRLAHALRRTHQAVARTPPSRLSSVSGLANDNYIHALYEDLMIVDSPQTAVLESSSESIDTLLAKYAKRGNTQDFELCMSRMLPAPPAEHQRDLHVKAHIVNASLSPRSSALSATQRFPTGALAVLHKYEASGHFAPIKSYTRVISALFNVQTCPSSEPRLGRAAAQAQAWDLFAHMRYVAHRVPDDHLYALMIRACGSSSPPEPERALDLWMEMQENGVKPTRGAYEAVIRVCGRAGPEWLGEGTRLAREMSVPISDSGRERESTVRAGNLQKARWILAEAVRGNGHGASGEDSIVDAELMTHIFHTYVSYKPPFRRETTRLIDCDAASTAEASTNESQAEVVSIHRDPPPHVSTEQTQDVFPDVPAENVESIPSFSRLPPQTSFDIIAEVQALFSRILEDRSLSLEEARRPHPRWLARGHASIETSQEAFDSLFNDSLGTQVCYPDGYTYVSALERCAIARVEDRQVASRWAENIWRRWEETEAKGVRDGKGNVGSFARLIEKAHAAMRRVLVLSGDVDGALALLRSFVSRYPPNAVLQPADSQLVSLDTLSIAMPGGSSLISKSTTVQLFAKPPILSTRTALTNPASSALSTARPLVRLTSVVVPKDDRVPPVIGFSDVDLLHARLAEQRKIKDLGYIKWVCMAYGNAMKKRRDAVLKAAPTRHEDEID